MCIHLSHELSTKNPALRTGVLAELRAEVTMDHERQLVVCQKLDICKGRKEMWQRMTPQENQCN